MCHLLQNSTIDKLIHGLSKLIGSLKPNIKASPIAMSEYPEKSKNICKVKQITKIQASKNLNVLLISKPWSTKTPRLSANTMFLNKPKINIVRPWEIKK